MLVLSRKVNENIVIDGRIIVKVVRTEGSFVKLGIEAPADVPVHRQEIYEEIQKSNQAALTGRPSSSQLRHGKTTTPPVATSAIPLEPATVVPPASALPGPAAATATGKPAD